MKRRLLLCFNLQIHYVETEKLSSSVPYGATVRLTVIVRLAQAFRI